MLLGGDPAGDGRPMLLQGARPHEQPDVAAGYGLLHDVIRWRAEAFGGIEPLLRRRDVVAGTRKQVGRAGNVVKIELAAQANEFTFASLFSLKNCVITCRYHRPGRSIGFSCRLSNASRFARYTGSSMCS